MRLCFVIVRYLLCNNAFRTIYQAGYSGTNGEYLCAYFDDDNFVAAVILIQFLKVYVYVLNHVSEQIDLQSYPLLIKIHFHDLLIFSYLVHRFF